MEVVELKILIRPGYFPAVMSSMKINTPLNGKSSLEVSQF